MLIAGVLLVLVGVVLAFIGGFGSGLLVAAVWPLAGLIFLSGIVLIASSRIVAAIHAGPRALASHASGGMLPSGAVQPSGDAESAPGASARRRSFWAERRTGDVPMGYG